MAPHRHIVVDVTVTSARTNTNVARIGARRPFPGSLALGAQHGRLDAATPVGPFSPLFIAFWYCEHQVHNH
jgi:hypothetical protein